MVNVVGGLFNAGVGLAGSYLTADPKQPLNGWKLAGNFIVDFGVGFATSGSAGITNAGKLQSVYKALNKTSDVASATWKNKAKTAVAGEVVKGLIEGKNATQISASSIVAGTMAATGVAGKAGEWVAKKAGAITDGFTPLPGIAALLQRPAERGTGPGMNAFFTEALAAPFINLPLGMGTSMVTDMMKLPKK